MDKDSSGFNQSQHAAQEKREALREVWNKARGSVANADRWHDFSEQFHLLVDRDDPHPLQARGDWVNGWQYRWGDRRIIMRFEAIAERAGHELGCPDWREPKHFWQDCAFFYLDQTYRPGPHHSEQTPGRPALQIRLMPIREDSLPTTDSNSFVSPPAAAKRKIAVVRAILTASEELCLWLETQAGDATPAKSAPPSTRVSIAVDANGTQGQVPAGIPFPNRAKWLADRLRERAWNPHDLARFHGPDSKTTSKVLKGLPVRPDVLQKIAAGLSFNHQHVALLAIPED
jgi:hypothetical protein